jgi:hypothetical protein
MQHIAYVELPPVVLLPAVLLPDEPLPDEPLPDVLLVLLPWPDAVISANPLYGNGRWSAGMLAGYMIVLISTMVLAN